MSIVPTDITGCKLWLDANDTSSVTVVGGYVTLWNDKSGNNYHGIGKYRVLHNSVQLNGKPVMSISWDGTNRTGFTSDTDAGGNGFSLGAADNTVFIVFRRSNVALVDGYLFCCFATGGSIFSVHGLSILVDNSSAGGGSVRRWYPNTDPEKLQIDLTSTQLPSATWLNVALKRNNGNANFYKDNSSIVSDTYSDTSVMNPTKGWALVGQNSGNDAQFSGDIAECIVYNSALSDTDRNSVYAYLNEKWFGTFFMRRNILASFQPISI